jgi:hypothetical protein
VVDGVLHVVGAVWDFYPGQLADENNGRSNYHAADSKEKEENEES